MSFRRLPNKTEQWRNFCDKHRNQVDQLPRLASLFSSAQRFDEFLQNGIFVHGKDVITIMSLTDAEWVPFVILVDHYSRDWESYFTETEYRGYFTEYNQRRWQPSSPEFVNSDLSSPRLIIHFWARWNASDRTMDANLFQIVSRFEHEVLFRSIDVGRLEFREVCTDADVWNVPTIGFYTFGRRIQTVGGVRSPEDLANIVSTWISKSNERRPPAK